MKPFNTLLLIALTLLLGSGQLWASEEYKREGYQSKFYGSVEVIPEGNLGTWIVNGRKVEVSKQTRIEEEHGRALVGAYIEVKGTSDGQTFLASTLEVKRGAIGNSAHHQRSDNEFYGIIRALPQGELGTWLIDDREVFVDTQTRLKTEHGSPVIGARVEVKGNYLNDNFHARRIEVKAHE